MTWLRKASHKHRANFGYDHGKAVLCSNNHQKAIIKGSADEESVSCKEAHNEGHKKGEKMDKRIKELKEDIDAELARTANKDVFNSNPQTRMELEISLLEQGCHVDQDEHGLLVNQKFIVAISKNKWCVKGKYVWYQYKDIPTFVSKYVRG